MGLVPILTNTVAHESTRTIVASFHEHNYARRVPMKFLKVSYT